MAEFYDIYVTSSDVMNFSRRKLLKRYDLQCGVLRPHPNPVSLLRKLVPRKEPHALRAPLAPPLCRPNPSFLNLLPPVLSQTALARTPMEKRVLPPRRKAPEKGGDSGESPIEEKAASSGGNETWVAVKGHPPDPNV